MSIPQDVELVLNHLDGMLPDAERGALVNRLRTEPELCELMMTFSYHEAVLTEWAKTRRLSESVGAELLAPTPQAAEETRSGGNPLLTRVAGAALAAAFLVAPPSLLAWAALQWSDYGLALPGWVLSIDRVVHLMSRILAALLALSWLGSWRLGWLKRPHACGVAGAASLLLSLAACEMMSTRYAEDETLRREEFIQRHRWISYDSVFYWPKDQEQQTGRPAQEPNDAQIRQELTVLRQAGFDGLFLHECRVGQLQAPKLARELGFKAVVQGIRVVHPRRLDDAQTQQQIDNALSISAFVDAYVLGELSAREVDLAAVKAELARIRKATKKPVTTSFLHEDYIGKRGDRLRELEDFTVRALARPWLGNQGDPKQAARAVQDALDTLRHDDRPSLLTTVFFPTGGGPKFSEEGQFTFFSEVLKLKIPRGVAIVYFSSFDRPWVGKLAGVPEFERHTGLFGVQFSRDQKEASFIERKAVELFKASQP